MSLGIKESMRDHFDTVELFHFLGKFTFFDEDAMHKLDINCFCR